MVDYVKLAATAERLIRENGREVVFVKNSVTPIDPQKPWNGSIDDSTELTLRAVFVPPNTVRQFGLTALGEGSQFVDLYTFSEQIAILYPGENDLKSYKTIRDNGVNWNMIGFQLLKPASINMLAFVGTRR